jgi:hypothetical protein
MDMATGLGRGAVPINTGMKMREIINLINEAAEDPNLSVEELRVLLLCRDGLEWWLASSSERSILRKLKKLGLVWAGSSAARQKQRQYTLSDLGERLIWRYEEEGRA